MPVFQINFSRPAGQIIASYYNFLRLGHEGYRRVHEPRMRRPVPAAEIVKLGPFELLAFQPEHRDPDRDLADSATARTPGTRCSTWPTGCVPAAGRYRPTP